MNTIASERVRLMASELDSKQDLSHTDFLSQYTIQTTDSFFFFRGELYDAVIIKSHNMSTNVFQT